MSDWFRALDPLGLLAFGLACLGWSVGGWLAARTWFSLRPGERLVAGLSAGFVVYLTLVNLLTPLTGLFGSSLISSGLILAAGLWAALRRRTPWAELRADLRDWPQLAVLIFLTLVFELAQRGVSLFDEYMHLPMVSIMGTGSIPPVFYLNPQLQFAYHYGLQIFAAVLENLARFFPWSAWDLARGLAIAMAFNLSWLWARRGAGRSLTGALGALALVFGGGARWLMLLLPGSALAWVSAGVSLSNTGADTAPTLALALNRPWVIEGGGTIPFPFAFHDGVFIPQTFALGQTGALPVVTLLLLLLLARPAPRPKSPQVWLPLVLILANLALSAEHLFAFVWISIAAVAVFLLARARLRRPALQHDPASVKEQALGWSIVLAASALLSIFQGGFVTETMRTLLQALQGQAPAVSNLYGFALRWPPAIVSAHLGTLSPFNLRQLVALLAEMGPVLLAAPLASVFAWRAARRGDWLVGGLGLSALLMVLFTLFFAYGVDRSSTRFAGSSLWLWLALAFPLLWRSYRRAAGWGKAALGILFGISLYGGLVIFAIQLTAVPRPIPAYFIDSLDLAMSARHWNRLPVGAQVLDNNPEQAVTVFGRASKAYSSIYVSLPEWVALMADPIPQKAAAYGFSYVYMNPGWWSSLTPSQQAAYRQPCVRLVDEVKKEGGEPYRRLLDISSCK